MTDYEDVRYEVEGPIAVITIGTAILTALEPLPQKVLVDNGVIGEPLTGAAKTAFDTFERDPTPRNVVLFAAAIALLITLVLAALTAVTGLLWELVGQRMVRAAPRSIAVAGLREGRVEQRLQHLQDRLLHQPVDDRRDAQLTPSFATGFGNFHSPNRLRVVPVFQQFLRKSRPLLSQIPFEVAHFQAVHPRGSPVLHDPAVGFPQVLRFDHSFHQLKHRRLRIFLLCRGIGRAH